MVWLKSSWLSTAAIASVSALAVTMAALTGHRAGRGEGDALAVEAARQRAAVDRLAAELEQTRADRDRIAAERDRATADLRAKSPPVAAGAGKPGGRRGEPFNKW